MIKKTITKFILFLRRWNELLTLPIALVAFYFMKFGIWKIDDTAGTYDLGRLQVFVFATIGLYFGVSLIWIMLKIGAPDIYHVLDDYLLKKDTQLTPWQKGLFSLSYFSVLLLAWVFLVNALM